MKIKLNILERELLRDLLTLPNSFYNFTKRILSIRQKLVFDQPGTGEIEIEFENKEFWMISNQLKRMDKQYKFQEKYIPLYNKFVIKFLGVKNEI